MSDGRRQWPHYFPLALLIAFLLLRYIAQDLYDRLVVEDGVVEDATVIVYLVGSGAAAATAWRLRASRLVPAALLYAFVSLALLGIAVEEISWGQRMFGFEGPEVIVEHNKQEEVNVHNLLRRPFLHSVYLAVGIYGAGVGRLLLLPVDRLNRWSWLLAPDRCLFWYFACVVLVYGWFELSAYVLEPVFGEHLKPRLLGLSRLQEVAELGLGLGFLLFVWSVHRRAGLGYGARLPRALLLSDSWALPKGSPRARRSGRGF